MQQIFTNLSSALEGQTLLTFGAAFMWGVLSVVLSPCHLASIPLVVGYVGQQKEITTPHIRFTIAAVFVLLLKFM